MIRAASRFQSARRVISARPIAPVEFDRTDEYAQTPPLALPTVFAVDGLARRDRWLTQRQFSSSPGNRSTAEKDFSEDSTPSVDETLDKLFQDSQEQIGASADALAAASAAWEPTWYNIADQCVVAINTFHDLTGLEYGWSIVGVTVIMRLALFPVMVTTQQTTSRMAHVQPELNALKTRYEALGTPSREEQLGFSKQMKALFTKYKVKPFRAFTAPLIQLPLFMGMFFGLKKMPVLFPEELATGGLFWFPDLTLPDPMYIRPLMSAGSFLLLIEMGKEQMMAQNAAQGQLMVNVFRVLSLGMLPVCVSFEASMLCYWTANNILTIAQTGILKTDSVRKYFGIWDPPKPVPGAETQSLTEAASKLMKKLQGEATTDEQKIKQHNTAIENKKKALDITRKRALDITREARTRKKGITGTRNF
jgi:YidC/Oxa1 family membrane protein insertase